jgi:hypothetical protein
MQYRTGTISVNIGSATVTGVGTRWLVNASTSDIFIVVGDTDFYEIQAIASDTSLTISPVYAGAANRSGVAYAIVKDYTYHYQWPTLDRGDVEWPMILSEALNRIDTHLNQTPSGSVIRSAVFEPSTTPAAVEGKLYYDSVGNAFYFYNGTSWRRLSDEAI